MSRECFLYNLVGLVFFTHGKAFGTGNIEVWLKIYGATTYGQAVTVYNSEGAPQVTASITGATRKLGDYSRSHLAQGAVVMFQPWDQNPEVLIPVDRKEIPADLSGTHTLTIVVNDGVLSVEYN